ncbi:MAG: hypothetical protein JF614_32235, partial [Acidobacteria bacterium]|nr:hypothetical protein [Acidobacteriota bacterium]
ENLLNEDLSAPWRSGSIAAVSTVSVTWTFNRVRPVDWLSFHKSNIRLPFKVELKDALGGSLAVSAWTEPVVLASLSDFPWDSLLWTLGPDAEWLEDATAEFMLDSFVTFPVGAYPSVKSVVLTFDTSSHTNDGSNFLQFALPMIGRRYRPSINMALGWSLPLIPRSEVVRTESGAKLGRTRSMQRSAAFELPQLGPETPESGRIEVFRQVMTRFLVGRGELARIFFWPEPSQRWLFYDTSMVCCIEQPPKPTMATLEWPGLAGFTLQETF